MDMKPRIGAAEPSSGDGAVSHWLPEYPSYGVREMGQKLNPISQLICRVEACLRRLSNVLEQHPNRRWHICMLQVWICHEECGRHWITNRLPVKPAFTTPP